MTPTPSSAGPTGGGKGWADVWKRGCFAWEYKGPRANLYNDRPTWLVNAR